MSSRKLLILDLNGTLLLRAKHSRAGGRPSHGPRPRTVYPRPYLSSFREYIFHPTTLTWLDTMVWSSAQPASVADMVNHCFGTHKRAFVDIWARDRLGLPPELYHKKTPTTKDLVRAWEAFPAHNAHTTLLLDDSARKAHRHPYNHVCVLEYTTDARRRDLKVLADTQPHSNAPKKEKAPKKRVGKPKTESEDPKTLEVAADVTPAWALASSMYDETLLAVVGILDALKPQPSVAGWIQRGGLLSDADAPANDLPATDAEADAQLSHHLSALSLTPTSASTQNTAGSELESPAGPAMPDPAAAAWFASEPVVAAWVARGRHALAALQIDVVAGIAG